VWISVMSSFSTDAFSATQTSRFLFPVLYWLYPDISATALDLIHFVVRKGMHVGEYGVLALLWYRALGWPGVGWQTGVAVKAFVLTAVFGMMDEAHQVLAPTSRTGSLTDVGWDTLGAMLSLLGRRALGS